MPRQSALTLGFLALFALGSGLTPYASQLVPGSPGQAGVKPILSNERVTVTDVTWTEGQPLPVERQAEDRITVFLQGGSVRTRKSDGSSTTTAHALSSVTFDPKGTDTAGARDAVGTPVHAIVINLHDHPVPPLAKPIDLPEAFPRAGSRRLLENSRVIVWEYTFVPGITTPMHFHSRDVVSVYTDTGAVQSTTPDGESVVNEHYPGEAKFNPRNRTHTEELASGTVHLIAVELK